MYISYFEYMTGQINAVKDKPHFIKEYGKDYMRAFQEEMMYAGYYAICDSSIDINVELERIENKYGFNDDMDILLSAVAIPVRKSVLSEYSRLFCKCKESKEADSQSKQFCKFIMEQIDHAVHINRNAGSELVKS